MTCDHNDFPTLAPTTVDDLAATFDAATIAAMQRDAQQLAAGNGPAAEAWTNVAATLAQAYQQRAYDERRR